MNAFGRAAQKGSPENRCGVKNWRKCQQKYENPFGTSVALVFISGLELMQSASNPQCGFILPVPAGVSTSRPGLVFGEISIRPGG